MQESARLIYRQFLSQVTFDSNYNVTRIIIRFDTCSLYFVATYRDLFRRLRICHNIGY